MSGPLHTLQKVKQQDRKLKGVAEPEQATMLLPQGPGVGQDLTKSDRVVGIHFLVAQQLYRPICVFIFFLSF